MGQNNLRISNNIDCIFDYPSTHYPKQDTTASSINNQ